MTYPDPQAAGLHHVVIGPDDPIPLADAAHVTVPEGWALVPIKPTMEMVKNAVGDHEGESWLPHSLWASMLAATPDLPKTVKLTPLPQDVINLVIAAREVAYSVPEPEMLRALDKAVEVFAERVPWDDDPGNLKISED